jgi:RHS repeat-associated protein
LRFPGQYYDAETGLHYNYHRYYDPALSIYMSEDQIGFIGEDNLYKYVLNNPVIFVDPFGLAVGSPGTRESLIPVWGSGRSAINQFQHGNITCGLINSALAVSDVFLVKAVATGIVKGAVKTSGSFTWRSVRSWYGKEGFAETGQHVHHWLIHQKEKRIGVRPSFFTKLCK